MSIEVGVVRLSIITRHFLRKELQSHPSDLYASKAHQIRYFAVVAEYK